MAVLVLTISFLLFGGMLVLIACTASPQNRWRAVFVLVVAWTMNSAGSAMIGAQWREPSGPIQQHSELLADRVEAAFLRNLHLIQEADNASGDL